MWRTSSTDESVGSETYFKKVENLLSETKGQYHFKVFRYNAMLPYRSNRTGKISHDNTSEQQNLNAKLLFETSAIRLTI